MGNRSTALPDMEFIRYKIPIAEVANALSLKVSGSAVHCWRAGHQNGDRTPSMSFRGNYIACFVCDPRPLSTLDLVMLHEGLDLLGATQWICERWNVPTIAKGKKLIRSERWHGGRVGVARFPFEYLVRSGFWASLDDATRAILPALVCFADPNSGEAEISYAALQRYSGKSSRTTISAVITKLERLGLLKVSRAMNGSFRACGRYRLDWQDERFQSALDSCHEALKLDRDAERTLRSKAKAAAQILKSTTLSTVGDCQQSARYTVLDCALLPERQPQTPQSSVVDCALSQTLKSQSLEKVNSRETEKASDFPENSPRTSEKPRCCIHRAKAEFWFRPDGDAVCALCHPAAAERQQSPIWETPTFTELRWPEDAKELRTVAGWDK